ncbi:NAD(P)H-hydrate dehydratase [Amylibacter sp. IMCC11727]|uniref:NAD(P)H-hydrate dehydratase n=1 Tax=Amylibacter sp. IMCC11727 TaxID=3039851 RepID=UPI00244E100B|nr:NAD(P)H-hydrate dehydratase [Amylibacter sp. IMCC11727]WGI20400.1 NAD(P)H-hydrate dehydratase [Amylibacter sp. IMCC11727]
MTALLTAAQMRTIEQAAIDSGEVTGLELMERAGQGVVEAIFEEWPDLKKTSHRAVVLCGPGNNGGDGFVVARLLKEWGWEVEVFFYGDAEKLPADAKVNYERWAKSALISPLTKKSLSDAVQRANDILGDYTFGPDGYIGADYTKGQHTIFVDALLGTGLTRKFSDDLLEISQEWDDECWQNGVAIDIASGLSADSGEAVGGNWFYSRLVVTFHKPKTGHYLGPCNYDVSKIHCKDIGLAEHDFEVFEDSCALFEKKDLDLERNGFFNFGLQKAKREHKFSHGHALICSGPATKTGAARLAARGALRIGAGLVTVASPSDALPENAAQLTAIMLREANTPADFETLLSDNRISSICIGPGFAREVESGGLDFSHTREMVKTALAASTNALSHETGPLSATGPRSVQRRPVVLDADALSAFQDDPSDLFQHLHKNCVLTPHGGEFKRLFPDIHAKLIAPATTGPAYSKVDATRDAAKRAGCTVLFKGADTVIANEQGRACINSAQYDRAAPWLATAGSGDVLAGFITGLLARSFAPMQAAETAAWLHVECALKFGPGLIAEDISEQLPAVFADLGL